MATHFGPSFFWFSLTYPTPKSTALYRCISSLQQAYEFAGWDPHRHKMLRNNCGNLKWIPYETEQHDDWGISDILKRPIWTEDPSVYTTSTLVVVDTGVQNGAFSVDAGKEWDETNNSGARHVRVMEEQIEQQHKSQFLRLGLGYAVIITFGYLVRAKGWCQRNKSAKSKI